MVILDATVVNVALPSIQRDLGFSAANLQWVINGYTLVFGGFLLLGGRAGDLFGRRRLFLAGVAIFSFASLLNGLATSDTWLVAARALQGLGGALVSPAALNPRSAWIDGSATFTTVASRMTMNCARQTMTRTSQRLVSPDAGGSTTSTALMRTVMRLEGLEPPRAFAQ